jgi:predicted dehydrogenase
MAPVRIAVIGSGMIGRRHIEVLKNDPDRHVLAAIADPAPAAAQLAGELGVPHFTSHDILLDREKPDGVIIATPNQLHASVGLACVERKIPVLVEKPIADSIAAALDLVEAAERARVPVLVGHHRRHNPIMQKAAEVIRSGGIGKVLAVAGLWLSHKPKDYFNVSWRGQPGGGPVLINGIHDIDCLRMLCGEIETVQAKTARTARGLPVEDTAAAVLTFASGALGTLLISDSASAPWSWEWTSRENPFYPNEPENCYLISGTRGSLTVPSLELRWHEEGRENWGLPLKMERIPVRPADPYVEQMRNFVDVICGRSEPVLSGADGTRTLAATLAISISAESGQPVRVADLLKRERS